ncbi:MAG: phosphoenolpyruvate--protein phosphotransferase [Geminicoccaceae bacterium]
MAERILRGRSASPGLAIGPLVRQMSPELSFRLGETVDPLQERARFDDALQRAREQLQALAATSDEMSAEILEFQLEVLADSSLAEETSAAIGPECPAFLAWHQVLQPQIMSYEEAEDEYFRARAGDMKDVEQRVLRALGGVDDQAATLPPGAILVDDDLTPSAFLALNWRTLGGIALERGSPTAHVAMLARARGVPMATNLGEFHESGEAVLDAEAGRLVVRPEPATRDRYLERLGRRRLEDARAAALLTRLATTAAGERVEVMLNVDDPAAVGDDVLDAADGVGLFRTEFLFIGRDRLPDEGEQLCAYRRLLERLRGKPCIVRTLDIGGDKPLPGLQLPAETNPFLGLRGLRLCLDRKDLFRPQVRALLRAAAFGPLKVMLPMVATADEYQEARAFVATCHAELEGEGIQAKLPPLGIMVETPAAAVAIDLIPADFYSIGSNDLTQYVMAASRDAGGRVAGLLDPLQPAVLRLIEGVVRHGSATGIPVSLCGDMGSEPVAVAKLLSLGLRRFSVAPAALGRVKLAISGYGRADG